MVKPRMIGFRNLFQQASNPRETARSAALNAGLRGLEAGRKATASKRLQRTESLRRTTTGGLYGSTYATTQNIINANYRRANKALGGAMGAAAGIGPKPKPKSPPKVTKGAHKK